MRQFLSVVMAYCLVAVNPLPLQQPAGGVTKGGGGGAANTFTLVQVKSNNACSATDTCAVTVTATGSGHVIIVGLIDSANQTITSILGGGTYTLCATSSCAAGDATTGWTDMAYTLNSTAGATSITITHTAGANNSIGVVWEYSVSPGPAVFDAGGANNVIANCTACAGTTLTLSGSSDVISTVSTCSGTCTAVSAPYTNDLTNPGGDTVAHLLGATSGAAATFNQSPTGHMTSSAIAIK